MDKSEVGEESKNSDVRRLYSISPTLQHNSLVMLPPVAPPERKTVISSDKKLQNIKKLYEQTMKNLQVDDTRSTVVLHHPVKKSLKGGMTPPPPPPLSLSSSALNCRKPESELLLRTGRKMLAFMRHVTLEYCSGMALVCMAAKGCLIYQNSILAPIFMEM